MAKDSGGKFVVLHGTISLGGKTFERGQVIAREEVEEVQERLTELGAIRPASSEEVGQDRVDVWGVPLALSPLAQAELMARDARIESLRSTVGDLQARVNAA